jgi:AcrR family transcriptional regulator
VPRVLPEYLELRRRQIIEAAAACFDREGFHRTSMQDICREAELSPGAIYRYFRSKEEIIEAMGEEHLRRDLELIEAARRQEDTLEVFEELARLFFNRFQLENAACDVELYAEALRNETIRETLKKGSDGIRESFKAVIQRAQERREIKPSLDPDAVARAFMALFGGFVLQKAVDPDADIEAYTRVVMSLANGSFWIGGQPSSTGPIPQH